MSIPYEASGRVEQKTRTRQALVEAARELLAGGSTPRVEDAAVRARISRTTAYRYFANQRSLLLAAQPQMQPDTLLPPDAPREPRARLAAFMSGFAAYNLRWEPQLRSALRLSLEDATAERPLLRRGRAIGWIEDALAPLANDHPHVDRHALAVAIRSATGIESLIWLMDIAGQTRDEAATTVRGTALALLDAALAATGDAAAAAT
ncbi:TetR/AcrR family transcriptional regulator [Paractinoplanes lichenicola]|uniref:TetR/AcrR family transcriptional regulator n=1 Tax=Paractinoplanes lichenicola TaxID=2802976 RepID=A0ABS1VP76_9ACTN|nr:TetR/AcrR family transcriptional regulator [Actinoplanes lichenicola]MBL7256525.1 TetR/AcrR family transcriptional regulator [Actinoplanes lichenicola]